MDLITQSFVFIKKAMFAIQEINLKLLFNTRRINFGILPIPFLYI